MWTMRVHRAPATLEGPLKLQVRPQYLRSDLTEKDLCWGSKWAEVKHTPADWSDLVSTDGQIWSLLHHIAMTTSTDKRGEVCCAEPPVMVIHGMASKRTYSSGSEKTKNKLKNPHRIKVCFFSYMGWRGELQSETLAKMQPGLFLWMYMCPLCKSIITMKEPLLRFTTFLFSGQTHFKWECLGQINDSIKIAIFKTLRRLDTTWNFARSITRVSTHEHEHWEHCLCTQSSLKRTLLNNST